MISRTTIIIATVAMSFGSSMFSYLHGDPAREAVGTVFDYVVFGGGLLLISWLFPAANEPKT